MNKNKILGWGLISTPFIIFSSLMYLSFGITPFLIIGGTLIGVWFIFFCFEKGFDLLRNKGDNNAQH